MRVVSGYRRVMSRWAMIAALMAAPVPSLWAAQPDAISTQEIAYLFGYLEKSGCEFNRNGSWYAAVEASKHLRDKYDYLVDKGVVDSAETFIKRAASESSMSGNAYQVKCANAPVMKSADWFGQALAEHRKGAASAK